MTSNTWDSQAFYVQLAYRLPWQQSKWKPYYRFEYIHKPETDPTFRNDVPLVTTVTGARDYVRGLPTKNDYGAIYFPWVDAPDPIGSARRVQMIFT